MKYNQSLFLLILFLTIPIISDAQYILKGKIVNGEDGEPLPFANLFLNNTTTGTATNVIGEFELRILPGNHELVASFVGFEPFIYDLPDAKSHPYLIIRLKPQELDFDAVEVTAKRDKSWYFYLERFKYYFLGNSLLAEKCTIENPEVLIIDFDEVNRTLKVKSKDYLIINNPGLGYKVNFLLEEFVMEEKFGRVFFAGYPYFEEKIPKNKLRVKTINKKRVEALNGSSMHWIRSLILDELDENLYTMQGIKRIPNPDRPSKEEIAKAQEAMLQHGNDQQAEGGNVKITVPNSKIPEFIDVVVDTVLTRAQILQKTVEGQYFLQYPHIIKVEYRGEKEEYKFRGPIGGPPQPFQTTFIHLQEEKVFIDPAGYVKSPIELFFEGYMGWEKVGDLLPIDYSPKDQDRLP